jgi:hypothetical protein
MSTRKLKVGAQYRPGAKPYAPIRTVPHLRLTGEWMRRAGFYEGDSVSIIIDRGALTIRLCAGDIFEEAA